MGQVAGIVTEPDGRHAWAFHRGGTPLGRRQLRPVWPQGERFRGRPWSPGKGYDRANRAGDGKDRQIVRRERALHAARHHARVDRRRHLGRPSTAHQVIVQREGEVARVAGRSRSIPGKGLVRAASRRRWPSRRITRSGSATGTVTTGWRGSTRAASTRASLNPVRGLNRVRGSPRHRARQPRLHPVRRRPGAF